MNQDKTTSRIRRFSPGFTLVETLIAVTVLMIAIAGPLVVASKGLTAALYARDQMIAAYLAQESMEIIKNIRDNNVLDPNIGPSGWLTGMASCTSKSSACDASFIQSGDTISIDDSCDGNDGGCQLYYSIEDGYGTDPTGEQTIFKRYFYFIDSNSDPLPPSKTAVVVVTWNQGVVPNELVLMSELVPAIR